MAIQSGTGHSLNVTIIDRTTTNTGGATVDPVTFRSSSSYTNGTGADQADRQFTRNITSQTGSAVYVLSSFANATASGLAMVKVKLFYLKNTGTVDIAYGPDSTAGWNNFVSAAKTLKPGGVVFFDDPEGGITVSAGSADRLKIDVPSGTGAYELQVAGPSA